jgi:hypothetical protein
MAFEVRYLSSSDINDIKNNQRHLRSSENGDRSIDMTWQAMEYESVLQVH